ncbi:MAG: hypothetical protein [Olavius algarvensis Gamma 1 endosymbiont]|nr:MAG: hypothetical protein [Olavius algarvensis Gamma 1 endosymbiont]
MGHGSATPSPRRRVDWAKGQGRAAPDGGFVLLLCHFFNPRITQMITDEKQRCSGVWEGAGAGGRLTTDNCPLGSAIGKYFAANERQSTQMGRNRPFLIDLRSLALICG